MTRRIAPYLAAVLVLAGGFAAGSDLGPLATIAIQDGGRLKPLDTFARETARRVSGARPFTGGETIGRLDPSEWVLSMLADPERWKQESIVRVAHAELRGALGLPADRDRYSFAELVGHQGFMNSAERVQEKLRQDGDARLEPVEQEIATLYDTLSILAGIFSGEALRIVPDPQDPKAAWVSVADLGHAKGDAAAGIRTALGELVGDYSRTDRVAAAEAAGVLQARLAAIAPQAYPASRDLEREAGYNRLKPFRWAWILYLLGFLTLLASFPLNGRKLARAGFLLIVAGFAFNTHGMVLRVLISGRPPVTNMYESVIFVAWGMVLLALIFEAAYRARFVATCAAGLATVSLVLADNVPILNGSIEPLVPVLRDNMWLTLHVLTITLGYAAFFLAMGLGHLNLGLFFFAPRRASVLKTLSLFLYRALQVGTLFLAAGTLLGGVWASYSWGRFWGWDPKETWALIALLGYLAILHGRFLGWFRDFGIAVGSILGFLGVLMAWYGVNFILGTGLHSYGFGAGGYGYVGGFVAFEVLVVVGAFLRRKSLAEVAAAPAAARLRTNP